MINSILPLPESLRLAPAAVASHARQLPGTCRVRSPSCQPYHRAHHCMLAFTWHSRHNLSPRDNSTQYKHSEPVSPAHTRRTPLHHWALCVSAQVHLRHLPAAVTATAPTPSQHADELAPMSIVTGRPAGGLCCGSVL